MTNFSIALLAVIAVGILWYGLKLTNGMISDIAKLRDMSDQQLIDTIAWEKAEGQDGKKYIAEFERRHGPASTMSMLELGAMSSKLTKAGDYNNAYSRELRRRCCAGVKE